MNDTERKLHNWLHQAEARSSGNVHDVLIDVAIPAMAEALQTVLTEHTTRTPGTVEVFCRECGNVAPCATVRVITAALEGTK